MKKNIPILIILFSLSHNLLGIDHSIDEHSHEYNRIEQTLRFGNSEQVRRAMDKIPNLKVDEQKELIPLIEKLIDSRDILIKAKICTLVRKVEWNDLDKKILPYLEEENRDIFFKALNAIEAKKIKAATPILEKKIKESDFSEDDNKLQDMLRTLGKLESKNLNAYFLDKLNNDKTLTVNKNNLLVYFSDINFQDPNYKKYLKENFINEKISLPHKRYIVYAMGKSRDSQFKEPLKNELKKIDSIEDIDERKKYRRIKMQIISSLIELGDSNIYNILADMSRDDDEGIRIRAIKKMGELKIKEAEKLLEFKVKYDPSIKVINEAKKALKAIRDNKPNANSENAETQKNN